MACAAEKDQGATLTGFARILANADAGVFGSADDVLAIFNTTDEEFCNGSTTCLSAVCTFEEKSSCWAVDRQLVWNRLFNTRGVEMIQLQKGRLHFRTFNVYPEDLITIGDVKFLCLYLWLLRQHRCISGVVVSIPVLAPRHACLFVSLLRLTKYVQKCEIHGSDALKGQFLAKDALRASTLDYLYLLRELGLSAVHMINNDVTILARLVERNKFLIALILIDVEMSVQAFAQLVAKVVEHQTLEELRIKTTAMEPEPLFNKALGLIGQSRTISRLYIHVDRGLSSLLQGLLENSSVRELTLEPTISDAKVMRALADFLEKRESCNHLKACFNTSQFRTTSGALDDLQRIVGKSSLRSLVLSGSTLAPRGARRLADGVAVSRTLKELHLDDCHLACADLQPFVVATKQCATFGQFEELNVGAVLGKEYDQRELFRNILRSGVSDKITLVYNDHLVDPLREALEMSIKLVKFSLFHGVTTETEPLLFGLRKTVKTLRSLCIDTIRVLSSLGGLYVAHLIRKGDSLRVVRLRCRTEPRASDAILKALTKSRSVALLTIERWYLSESVGCTFADMLRQNRSLNRLEVYLYDAKGYELLKDHLVKGLKVNASVSVVKMYQGQQHDEVTVWDFGMLQCFRRNTMILAWVTDVILRDGMCLEAAAVADFFEICDAPLDLFQRTADFSPQMSVLPFAQLVAKLVKHKKLEHLRIKMTTMEDEPLFNKTLGLIGQSCTITRLYIHVDRGLSSLLQGLLKNTSLRELTLEPTINDAKVLCALANFLEKRNTCKHLKACLNTRECFRDRWSRF
ncbi:uncharacterized protein LOC142563341 [Dermacentor variabilis]|uniref:uncharacterized protein LOC142563341 n=1 Tax=Dermacentor variabilis TaxID=34621 RepID=UPI003F5B4D83